MQTSNPVDYDMKVTKIVLPALVIVSRTTLVFPLCPPTTVISDLDHITSTGKSFWRSVVPLYQIVGRIFLPLAHSKKEEISSERSVNVSCVDRISCCMLTNFIRLLWSFTQLNTLINLVNILVNKWNTYLPNSRQSLNWNACKTEAKE